eukprot:470528-Rhodomonas_salina.1
MDLGAARLLGTDLGAVWLRGTDLGGALALEAKASWSFFHETQHATETLLLLFDTIVQVRLHARDVADEDAMGRWRRSLGVLLRTPAMRCVMLVCDDAHDALSSCVGSRASRHGSFCPPDFCVLAFASETRQHHHDLHRHRHRHRQQQHRRRHQPGDLVPTEEDVMARRKTLLTLMKEYEKSQVQSEQRRSAKREREARSEERGGCMLARAPCALRSTAAVPCSVQPLLLRGAGLSAWGPAVAGCRVRGAGCGVTAEGAR